MTVSNTYDRQSYVASGEASSFAWLSDYDDNFGTLVVTELDASGEVIKTYVEGQDYYIKNKRVYFYETPVQGTIIGLDRHTYRGQEVTFIEGEDFPAKDYETSLDRLFMIEQEQDKGLADETAARIAADEVLQANIDTEEAARIVADTDLQNQINAEVSARQTADSALQTAINNEANARSTKDTELGVAIAGINNALNGEISARQAADTAITNSIGNGTITLTQGGVSKGTFTTNQSGNTTIDLDAGGGAGGGNCIYLRDMQAVHQAGTDNDSYGRIDVSSYIEAGKQYSPIVLITPDAISGTYPKTRLQMLQYLKSSCWFYNNYVEVRYYTSDVPSNTTRYDVFLIETDDETSYAVSGITNGLDGINIDPQTKTNLVTSVSSSSTDTQYPSAKCVYDIIGDVETLLQNV